jgi:hypothetical protein
VKYPEKAQSAAKIQGEGGWIVKRLEAETLVEWLQAVHAGQVQRTRSPFQQVFDQQAGNSLPAPLRANDQRSQLARSVAMRLHLAAANNFSVLGHCQDEVAPGNCQWVEPLFADHGMDGGIVSLLGRAQADSAT